MYRYPFEHIANFRDLGGAPTAHGMTRWGVFFRSALPAAGISEREIAILRDDLNIKTVIDLRTAYEIDAFPDPLASDPHITWIHHSLIGDMRFEEDLGININEPDTPTMFTFYCHLLNRCTNVFCDLMDYLKEGAQRGGTLFHCSVGKDRTGLTAMFLESLCGVPDMDIISRYEISRTLTEHIRADDMTGSHYSNMIRLLKHLRAHFKSPEAYLINAGVPPQTIDTLREALTAPMPTG